MVKKETIGKIQIGAGIAVLIIGAIIGIYAYSAYISGNNNPVLKQIGNSWANTVENSKNMGINNNESFIQLTSIFSMGANSELGNINQMKINLMLSELIIIALSATLILQGLTNISKE